MSNDALPQNAAADDGDDLEPITTPKRTEDDEMDITPMIDMTFLLLIFFLVSSKMDPGAGARLPPARHGRAVPAKESVVLTVTKGPNETAVVAAGGSVYSGADPEDQQQKIQEFVESEFARYPNRQDVLINADKGMHVGDISRVMRAAGRGTPEGKQIHIAVQEIH